MTVAGIMSGTSADGIDVALVRIASQRGQPTLRLIAHEGFAFPRELRTRILAAMNAAFTSTAELARLHWRLGIAYAEAIEKTIAKHKQKIHLIGCHGQTLYHQPTDALYAGRRFACTWQAGEAQVIASRLGIPVVSNFRPADMLAGGQGAPLVPMLDYTFFRHPTRGRVLQNIGGIANLTAMPAGALPRAVLAFDTGPGNMIIDWLAADLFGRSYDKDGVLAAAGAVLQPVLARALRNPYFRRTPPRTAGREQFGQTYAAQFLSDCRKQSRRGEDALATATAFTAATIAQSYERYVARHMQAHRVDFIVSGGGARNRTLMAMLSEHLTQMGCTLAAIDAFGMPAEAKEAAAFALLAWQTWHRLPGNVPSATGAARAVLLGQVTHA